MFGLKKQDTNVTENRSKYVGGSDVPIILGLSKYKTQFQLAKEKVGLVEVTYSDNEYTKYGNHLEPQIREFINANTDANFIVQTFVDEDKGIRSNVDGIDLEGNILLEIKTHGKTPSVKVYEAQMQLYMAQTGADFGWLAMYERPEDFDIEFDMTRLSLKEVERDNAYIEKILDAIEIFWIRCEYLKQQPDMTEEEFLTYGTDMDITMVKLYDLSPKIIAFKEQLKEMEVVEKQLKAELYEKMTENNIKSLETPLLKITRVLPTKVMKLDGTALKKEHPEIYAAFEKESERSGYVTIKVRKGEEATC